MQCFFTKEGFLRADGKADTKFIVKSLEDTVPLKYYQLEKVVSKCSKFNGDDGCENAFWVKNNLIEILMISKIQIIYLQLLKCFFKATTANENEL